MIRGTELPCYVRVLNTITNVHEASSINRNVEEDEILYVNGEEQNGWYNGSRLSGDEVSVHRENIIKLELPDRRPTERFFVASIADYDSDNRSDISFGKHTLIVVSKEIDANWYEGTVVGVNARRLGKAGLFPKSFVLRLTHLPENGTEGNIAKRFDADAATVVDRPVLTERYDQPPVVSPDAHLPVIPAVTSPDGSSAGKVNLLIAFSFGWMASVMFDFQGREQDELSVCAGDSVSVVKMVNAEWAFCTNPEKSQSGIIPVSFLHIFSNDEDDYEEDDDVCDEEEVSSDAQGTFEHSSDFDRNLYSNTFNKSISSSHLTPATPLQPALPPPQPLSSSPTAITIDANQLDAFFGSSSSSSFTSNSSWQQPAFGSSISSIKRIAPSRPPPPKMNAIKFRSTDMSGSSDKPTRPVSLPAFANNATHTNTNNSIMQTSAKSGKMSAEDMYAVKQRIEIENSPSLSIEQKKLFTKSIPQLRELSKHLVGQLTHQQGDVPEKQCYAEMRALGANVFDVHTAISRPIQRCLKYPLFIEELIKNTPLSHIDHPKLLEALKQMSLLASKMNESKRRKELGYNRSRMIHCRIAAQKYNRSEQEPLSKRLSRLNMHTVKKKSNRFKYRLTSQIGLIQMQRDVTFDAVVRNLEISERRVCKFVHAVQVYKHTITTQTKKYVDSHTTVEKLCDAVEEAKKYLRLPVTRMIQKRYDKLIDFESAKRSDKNADDLKIKQGDYEALNNQLKMTLPKIIDNINNRTFALVDEVLAKDEQYFARVTQLRNQLSPEVYAYFAVPYRHFVDPYESRIRSLIAISRMVTELSRSKNTTNAQQQQISSQPKTSIPKTSPISNGTTSSVQQRRLQSERERDALIRIMRGQGTESLLMTVVQRWPPDVVPNVDEQLNVERGDIVMIIEKGTQQQQPWLCDNGITKGYIPESCLEPYKPNESTSSNNVQQASIQMLYPSLNQSSNKIEAVKSSSRPLKKDENNLIDLEENLLDLSSPIKPQPISITPTPIMSSSMPFAEKPAMASESTAKLAAGTTTTPIAPSLSSLNPFRADILKKPSQSTATSSSSDQQIRLDSSDTIFNNLFHSDDNVTPIRFSTIDDQMVSHFTKAPLIPTRPTEKEVQQHPPRNINTTNQFKPTLYYSPPLYSTPPKVLQLLSDGEWYKAEYDFEGTDEIQLTINEGDKIYLLKLYCSLQLHIMKKSDDEGNDAWWLVENASGSKGYVPANYLSPISES
ncbi:unnamed protein product [Anisakis simplex]|uniref:SH3 domain-containing kinase-binding protein 1 n=1 Tax=Anisakis simplex TaxID=6269 RepID=A0A0M3JRN7_ANISI|nr:unnamed protein product [Anisakis simplex]